ncbi:MAG: putative transport system permease protein, partial [Candidatus Thermoplasmatota archaeon]|nr:putative transport system permease protein [Candidatus Thermoplasmatota archaeon]
MSALEQLAFLFVLVLVVIGLLAARRSVFAKMALRNILRRKRYSAIIVVGLLIATAMISAALVVGDTMDYIIRGDVYESTGEMDINIVLEDDAGIHQFFNESVAYGLIDALEAGDLPHVDVVAPAIREVATALEPVSGNATPSAYIYAYDPDNAINSLVSVGGEEITRDLITGGRAVANEDLAGSLGLRVGDTVVVYPKNAAPLSLEVSAIALDEGMGNWRFADLLFVDLGYAQDSVFLEPSMVNVVDVSCEGSIEEGYLVTDEAIQELKAGIQDDAEYTYADVKRAGVEESEALSDMVSQLFVLMSSFTIIAGVALIVNIFVMLAEERKPEMGISRAVGMQRGDLTQSFVFEGVVYALLASVVGTFTGLVIAFLMVNAFSVVMGGGGLQFVLHFEWASLALAAVAGFLITLMTVVIASWRVSRLNIVRAIRDIPEPILAKSERKYFVSGLAALAVGLLLIYGGASSRQSAGVASGMALIAFGGAMAAVRFAKPRFPFSIAGFWMIYWVIDPVGIETYLFGVLEGNLEMFIISGVLMCTGGVLIAMFNSDLMLAGLVRAFGRGRTLLPVFRAAISYPMNKKFRTGLTLFIFALIMFTVIVIAMIASFQRESVDTLSEKFSGGFEIVGYTLREAPEENLTSAIEYANGELGVDAVERIETASIATVTLSVKGGNVSASRNLVGFSDLMLEEGRFSLAQRDAAYGSDEEAWNAVLGDPSLTILDGSVVSSMFTITAGAIYVDLGDIVTVTTTNGTSMDMRVIGIMDQILVYGAFTTKALVESHAPGAAETLLYVDTVQGTGLADEQVLGELESGLAEYGLNGVVVRDIVEEAMTMTSSVMQLMEVFLGVGLIVGISGLGIITIRNIAERRQEIGVMRAIG